MASKYQYKYNRVTIRRVQVQVRVLTGQARTSTSTSTLKVLKVVLQVHVLKVLTTLVIETFHSTCSKMSFGKSLSDHYLV